MRKIDRFVIIKTSSDKTEKDGMLAKIKVGLLDNRAYRNDKSPISSIELDWLRGYCGVEIIKDVCGYLDRSIGEESIFVIGNFYGHPVVSEGLLCRCANVDYLDPDCEYLITVTGSKYELAYPLFALHGFPNDAEKFKTATFPVVVG